MIPTPRASIFGDCPHCGLQPSACPDPGTCELCSCVSCLRNRAVQVIAEGTKEILGTESRPWMSLQVRPFNEDTWLWLRGEDGEDDGC